MQANAEKIYRREQLTQRRAPPLLSNALLCSNAIFSVDATTCTSEIQEQYDIDVEASWLEVDGLTYSYGMVQGLDGAVAQRR